MLTQCAEIKQIILDEVSYINSTYLFNYMYIQIHTNIKMKCLFKCLLFKYWTYKYISNWLFCFLL